MNRVYELGWWMEFAVSGCSWLWFLGFRRGVVFALEASNVEVYENYKDLVVLIFENLFKS